MKTVDFKDLDFSKEMPSRKFIGETLFINLTEYKTFRNQQVYRLMMTPKHWLYDKDNSNVGGWVGIDVELDEDVWIDEDTVVIGKSVIYGAIEITHGSIINNCSITRESNCVVNLRDVSVIGKNSFILGHELKDISLLKNVEVKNGCKIEVNEGSMHIENKLFEGERESIEYEYEESGNLIIMN